MVLVELSIGIHAACNREFLFLNHINVLSLFCSFLVQYFLWYDVDWAMMAIRQRMIGYGMLFLDVEMMEKVPNQIDLL